MPDPNLITLIAAAIAIIVGPIIAWRTSQAALKRTATKDAVDSLQAEVTRLNGTIALMDTTETKHRTQIGELFTLGSVRQVEIDTLRSENMGLTRRIADNFVQCTADTAALRQQYTDESLVLKVRIAELEAQLKVSPIFNGKAALPVLIAGIDTAALPALPVKITDIKEEVILPVELKRPIPLPMTAAEVAAAVADEKQAKP